MKLQLKFALAVMVLISSVVMGMATMTVFSEKQLLERELTAHYQEITKRLARVCEESLYRDEVVLFNYLKELQNERGVISAYFSDENGKIQVHSEPSLIGTVNPYISSNDSSFQQVVDATTRNEIMLFSSPVAFASTKAGAAWILIDSHQIKQHIRQSLLITVKRLLFITSISMLLGIIGALWLAKTMIQPIRAIVSGIQEMASGHLEPIPELNRKDELGWAGKELNKTIVRLKELDEMKKEFISSVTHELRSPLTAIERFVSLLLKGTYGNINNEQKDSLMTVKNNTIRLGQFVDDVLTTSKLESRRMDLYAESFDVREAAEEVKKLYIPMALEKKIDLRFRMPSLQVNVWADKNKVIQILSNLISNSLKFTEKGSVEVEVKNKGPEVEITVSDTGPGFSKADKENIFGKFYRGLSTAHKVKGTGLGLFIVKSFLELQKGNINIRDNPKGGSIVSITLPSHP